MADEKFSNFLTDIIDADLAEGKVDVVHTRFPPEPNGYLHIGSAKAIFINYTIAKHYGGLFNLRFDDTNPAREGDEYVQSILQDLKWLGAEPNGGIFYGSDYFERCYEYAEQLIKEGDRVTGVYASDEDGNIIRVNAKLGVVLSTGDISSNTEMLTYYAPQATKYGVFFSSMDKEGKPVNQGDGHRMAIWAGAVMEDGPYAPMTHSLGTNSIGINPYLMVNQDGKRFANEDVGAQELQNAMDREVKTSRIGEMVMDRLKGIDEVAYVRFASVYRQFKDIDTFMTELNKLLSDK